VRSGALEWAAGFLITVVNSKAGAEFFTERASGSRCVYVECEADHQLVWNQIAPPANPNVFFSFINHAVSGPD
jgi:hypothetical protein